MKTLNNKKLVTLPMAAIGALSLALILPLAATQVVAEEQSQRVIEETASESASDGQSSSLRFSSAGRTEQSASVSWADLDMSRPAGLEQLYLRLSDATTKVCSPRESYRNIAMNRDRNACLRKAMDNAVRDVGHVGLGEMHASRTGRNVQTQQQIAGR